jgi:ubiquinone/menaquinone biosynthesis C-methylase UbiE
MADEETNHLDLKSRERLTESFFDRQTELQSWSGFESHTLETARSLIGSLPTLTGDTVLEPGCGAGRLTPFLSRAAGDGGRVISHDISSRMIHLARNREDCPNATFWKASVHDLPLPDDSVNFVICFNCFHNFDAPGLAVREIARVLRGGGRMVVAFTEKMVEREGAIFMPVDRLNGRRIPLAEFIFIMQCSGFSSPLLSFTERSSVIMGQYLDGPRPG